MARRLKANSGKTKRPKNGPVRRYTRIPGKGWSLPQAAHLYEQGYSDDHIKRVTGFPAKQVHAYHQEHGGML